ncbi:penicillin-binding protein 2 [Abyssibius alkaniclasticus]|uniref:penicillin-binding protein 2 n=1 Tax=Abyssibius alkaniclasticus TaxID=2881234 RepID=UPI00405A3999
MRRPAPFPHLTRARLSRRALLLGGVQAGIVGTLGWRMYNLQVTESERYRLLAEENRVATRLVPAARGLVFDRNGVLVAANDQNYRVVIVREQAGDVDGVLKRLAPLVGLDETERQKVLAEVMERRAHASVTVAEQLDWERFALVSANAPALPGVFTEVGLTRSYPTIGDFAHVAGYVSAVSEDDLSRLENPDEVMQLPSPIIGKTGIERTSEDLLRGKPGLSHVEVNATGRVMRELDRTEGTPGNDLQLTLDSDLQHYAHFRMKDESAAAVVIDLRNGDLRALASTPSFDPNKLVFGISQADWSALNNNEYRPLGDKTVSGTYPPGSTFKMVVALAALKAGVVTPEERIYCPGFYEIGGRRFHCWKASGHGRMNLPEGLQNSCDVYYYEIAQRVGIEAISEMAQTLGMGTEPDLPLPALTSGRMPTKAWKQESLGHSWLIGDTINAGIGQGFVSASPLELALMTARIASGRKLVPRLISRINGVPVDTPEAEPLDVSAEGLAQVRLGMYEVSNNRRGTAYSARITAPGMEMAGKTGTSQVRQITTEERAAGITRNEDLPWNRRDHALFVCYAPYDNPRFAVSVVVEHGGGGSTVAAPIARDILLRALYGTQPPLSAYPREQHEKLIEQRALEPGPTVSTPAARSDRA